MYKTASSANRSTVISMRDASGAMRSVKAQLNISQKTYADFKKIVECNMRQSPDDPIVEVSAITFRADDGALIVLSEENFTDFRPLALAQERVHLTISANTRPATPSRPRPAATKPEELSAAAAAACMTPSAMRPASPARKFTSPARRAPVAPISTSGTPGRSASPAASRLMCPGSARASVASAAAAMTPMTPNRSSLRIRRNPIDRKSPDKKSDQENANDQNVHHDEAEHDVHESEKVEDSVTEGPHTPVVADDNVVAADNENQAAAETTLLQPENNGDLIAALCADLDASLGLGEDAAISRENSKVISNPASTDPDAPPSTPQRNLSTGSTSSRSTARNLNEALNSASKARTSKGNATPAKKDAPKTPGVLTERKIAAMEVPVEAGSALREGGKTAAQLVNTWANSLRSPGGANVAKKPVAAKKPMSSAAGTFSSRMSGASSTAVAGRAASVMSPVMIKAMRRETKETTDDSGRPSMATMLAQWEFMREQFLNSSDEQLEWLMESKRGGAYKYAHNKNKKAEDQYFKSIVDIEVLEAKLNLLKSPSQLPELLKQMAASYDSLYVNPNDEEEQQRVAATQSEIKTLLSADLRQVFSTDLEKELKSLIEDDDYTTVARKSRRVFNNSLPEEIKKIDSKLRFCRKINEEALREMEKWSQREKETADYHKVMEEKDAEWMTENQDSNTKALRKMRSLIPCEIAEISIPDLMQRAKDAGHMMTLELAQELKNNKLLHWIVTAKEDIALSNFLQGDKRQFFVNLECLDVCELRAIRMCLPDKFELDSDGQKAEWRERFIGRLKQLAGQENGDLVSGPWDPECGRRVMVKLPELKADQLRRPVYFFRTYKQSALKLKQYDDKAINLVKKEKWLEDAKARYAELKAEYDTILEESRNPDFKQSFGLDVLNKAKEIAKREFQDAEQKMKGLQRDVDQLKRSIASTPITRDQFEETMNETDAYLQTRGIDWKTTSENAIIIGTTPEEPEITRINRSAAKFQSAEEEARKRKAEIEEMTTQRKNQTEAIDEVVINEEISDVENISSLRSSTEAPEIDGPAEEPVLAEVKKPGNVMQSANPDMINKLNSIFGGQAPMTPMRSKRVSVLTVDPAASSAPNDENREANVPAVPAVIKSNSKTLLRLVGKPVDTAPSSATPAKPMSFLEQIRARQMRAEGGDGASDEMPSIRPPAPPISFLDAIKLRQKVE